MKNNSINDAGNDGGTKWYDEVPKSEGPCKHTKSEVEVLDLKSEAKKCLDAGTAAFQLKQSKSRDSEILWLKTALSRGTSSDKIAANIVLIQDNPKYNLSRLVSLVSQVRAAKHNQCIVVIKSLQDLFLSDLLHPKFKLLKFEDQDLDILVDVDTLNNKNNKSQLEIERKKLLAHWYFEDQLREQYERFVTSLSAIASDTVDTNREKAVVVMAELLTANGEQEQKLLEFLVNKIGDPSSKVASKTVFSLGKVLEEHPNMKLIVLREVEKLLFRKNVAQRAQYYAICLLTQMVLDREDKEIATILIDVYFAFFKACLKRGEPDSRMMGAILTGVNRAYPFSSMDTNNLRNHIDSVYKVVHVGSFNVSLNALSLLHQVVGKDSTQADRFYSAFYRKLMDPQIGVSNKRAVFLNLLFRVLRSDPSIIRLHAFIKRILQVLMYFSANMACATLYVVSKVLQVRTDAKQILGPLSTRIKAEPSTELKSSDVSTEPSSSKMKPHLENDNDVKIMTEMNSTIDSIMLSNLKVEAAGKQKDEQDISLVGSIKGDKDNLQFYDPFARNPLRAGAYRGTSCTELLALTSHFHPSVALFATSIIQGKPIDYSGDPLEDLTLIRFLDRYVFKNPKKLEKKRVMKKNDPLAHRAAYTPRGMRSIPVDSMAYINEREERIPVDELFLYSYLKNKNELRNGEHLKKEKEEDDDNESVNSEEFNAMLDNLSKEKDFDELDIAGDFESTKINKKKIVDESDDEDVDEDEEEEVDDDDDDDDLMDEESDIDLEDVNEADDDDLDGLIEMDDIDDEDLSDIDFNDSDDEDGVEKEMLLGSKGKSFKKSSKDSGKNLKKKSKGLDENVFMSAEKFAEMLEEQGRSKFKHGGTSELSNADGASNKQLDWEMDRDQRLKGNYNRNKRKGGAASKKRKGVKRFKR